MGQLNSFFYHPFFKFVFLPKDIISIAYTLFNLANTFKAVKTPWVESRQHLHGWVWVFENGMRVDLNPLYRGMLLTSHIRIGEKFLILYKCKLLLTL